jgi:hypothetical protein
MACTAPLRDFESRMLPITSCTKGLKTIVLKHVTRSHMISMCEALKCSGPVSQAHFKSDLIEGTTVFLLHRADYRRLIHGQKLGHFLHSLYEFLCTLELACFRNWGTGLCSRWIC